MSQILKSLQFPTASLTPTTPPSGFGTIYASGSNKFYYKNPAGAEFDRVITFIENNLQTKIQYIFA